MTQPTIDWNYSGASDPLTGTGATSLERGIAHGFSLALAIIIVFIDMGSKDPVAKSWRVIILFFFAYDVAGGAVANMLNSCKRYYHSDMQPEEGTGDWLAKNVRVFTAIHIHPIIAAWLLHGNIIASIIWYVLLQVGVSVVLCVPLYVRRAIATGVVVLAILINEYWLPLGRSLEWFIPCLFIKMAIGHAVREEPYRPQQDLV